MCNPHHSEHPADQLHAIVLHIQFLADAMRGWDADNLNITNDNLDYLSIDLNHIAHQLGSLSDQILTTP